MGVGSRLATIATNLVAQFGYAGIGLGLILDSAGIPIPSEILLPLAGALVHQGRMNFVVLMMVATVAQTVGAIIAYELGAIGGLPLIKRYGKYILFSERELAITERWFARYGTWLALFGRCLPVIRTYIGYPAGLARMSRRRFVIASAIGSFGWSLILIAAGHALAGHLSTIDVIIHKFSLIILGLLLLGVIWYVKSHFKRAKTPA